MLLLLDSLQTSKFYRSGRGILHDSRNIVVVCRRKRYVLTPPDALGDALRGCMSRDKLVTQRG